MGGTWHDKCFVPLVEILPQVMQASLAAVVEVDPSIVPVVVLDDFSPHAFGRWERFSLCT